MIKNTLFFLVSAVFFLGCSGNSGENKSGSSFSSTDEIKLKKYYVSGQQLYKLHCNNCHDNGQGLAKLIPPLQDADYFADDSSKLICAIKFGLSGSIVVNGVEYNQPMPANLKLTNLEIAMLSAYVYKEFQNQDKLILPNEVDNILGNCVEADK